MTLVTFERWSFIALQLLQVHSTLNVSYLQNLRHILTTGHAEKLFISGKIMLLCTLLCQKIFYKTTNTLYNHQTVQIYVICESEGIGPQGMYNISFRNLAYLQAFYNRFMLIVFFEMCPSLCDNNKLWHFPVSPLLMRQRNGLSYGGAVSTTFGLHHLVRPQVEVGVLSRINN